MVFLFIARCRLLSCLFVRCIDTLLFCVFVVTIVALLLGVCVQLLQKYFFFVAVVIYYCSVLPARDMVCASVLTLLIEIGQMLFAHLYEFLVVCLECAG